MAGFGRLALGLVPRNVAGIGGGGPASAITSLEIVGPTLLDATGDYGDAGSRVGVNGNGWVAKVTVPYLVGQTFDPTKITINLSDPGYDATGTTTVTRQVRGGVILRRQYNAQASLQQSNNGVTLTVYFTLTADGAGFSTVHQGTTLVSANAASGFYGASASGSISSLTNSSTVAYAKPLFAWLQRHHTLVGAGGLYVEGVAYHAYGMNGRQVARVEYIGKDSQVTPNVTATQPTSTPILSTLLTKGQKPECYAATIPVTALTQADLCFVNAKVYPWIGDSSAVLDVTADGVGVTGNFFTANPQTPLRFVNDKAGTWGNTHASVKAGASGGTVQTTEVASRATPFPTIVAALAAMQTFNNAKTGGMAHNDTSGFIWLMDDGAGGAVEHIVNSDLNNQNAGAALTEIRKSPSNTANASVAVTAQVGGHPRISWHVDIRAAASSWLRGFNVYLAYYCDGTLDQSGSVAAGLHYQTFAIAYNLTQVTAGRFDVTGSEPGIHLLGYVNKLNTSDDQTRAHVIIGCDLEHLFFFSVPSGTGAPSSQDGKVVANNKFMKLTGGNACNMGDVAGMTKGFAFVQNVIERSGGATPALSISEQTTTQAIPPGSVMIANTIVGDRTNVLYCGVAGTVGVLKQMTSRFNLLNERNTKGDVFSGVRGNTGNWKFAFDVDNFDCVLKSDTNNAAAPGATEWIGEFWNVPGNARLQIANVPFKSDRSVNGTGAGGGDYRPTGTNAAINKVPAGKSPLAFFQNGVARDNASGTDAAGALPWAA